MGLSWRVDHAGKTGARPRSQRTLRLGADASVNVYSMDFRNEIAPIGALSLTGSPLRKNVGASYRRGVEADVHGDALDLVNLGHRARVGVAGAYAGPAGPRPRGGDAG